LRGPLKDLQSDFGPTSKSCTLIRRVKDFS